MSQAKSYRTAAHSKRDSSFRQAWSCETIRSAVLQSLDKRDVLNLRLASKALNDLCSPNVFEELTITLRPRTFDFTTRPARLRSLKAIGQHVKTLNFIIPQAARELDAVVINDRGEQQPYNPRVVPKADGYPGWDHGVPSEIMRDQRSPLWYAAGNIKAFIMAFECFPNVEHIRIQCAPEEPYAACFRTTVDRALTSIRIAIERAPLHRLEALTLNRIHLGGLKALHPLLGEAVDFDAAQRWRQILRLSINLDDFQDTLVPYEAWVMLHNYLWIFAPSLENMSFRFANVTCLFPFAMQSETTLPCKSTPANTYSLFQRLHFPNLQVLKLRNMRFRADQICNFLDAHCSTLRCIELDEIFARDSKIWQYAQAFGMTLEQWLADSTTVGQLEVNGRVKSAWRFEPAKRRAELNETPTKQARRRRAVTTEVNSSSLMKTPDESESYNFKDGSARHESPETASDIDWTISPVKKPCEQHTTLLKANHSTTHLDEPLHDNSSAALRLGACLGTPTPQYTPSFKASQTTLCTDTGRSEVTLIGRSMAPRHLNYIPPRIDEYTAMSQMQAKPQPGLLFGEVPSPRKSAVDAAVDDLSSEIRLPIPQAPPKNRTLLERAKSITNLVRLPSLKRRLKHSITISGDPSHSHDKHNNSNNSHGFASPETIRQAFQRLPPAKIISQKPGYKVTLRRAFSSAIDHDERSLHGFATEMSKEYLRAQGHVVCVPNVPLIIVGGEDVSKQVVSEKTASNTVHGRQAGTHQTPAPSKPSAHVDISRRIAEPMPRQVVERTREEHVPVVKDVNRDSDLLGPVTYPVLRPSKSVPAAQAQTTPITQLIDSFGQSGLASPSSPGTISHPPSPLVKQPGQLRRIKSSRCLSALRQSACTSSRLSDNAFEPLPAIAYDPNESTTLGHRMTPKQLKKLSSLSSIWSLRSDEGVVPIMYEPEHETSAPAFVATPTDGCSMRSTKRCSGLSTTSSLSLPDVQALTPDETAYIERDTSFIAEDLCRLPPALSIRKDAVAKLTAATFDRREALLDRVQRLKRSTIVPVEFCRVSTAEDREFEELLREMEVRAPAPTPEKMEMRCYF